MVFGTLAETNKPGVAIATCIRSDNLMHHHLFMCGTRTQPTRSSNPGPESRIQVGFMSPFLHDCSRQTACCMNGPRSAP